MLTLDPLPKQELVDYLITTFGKGGFKVSKDVASLIAERTGCHPHFSKVLSQSILDIALQSRKGDIDKKLVDNGFRLALLRIKGEMDNEWNTLSKAILQKKVMKFLVHGTGSLYAKDSFNAADRSQLYFAITELERKGIIRKKRKGEYPFVNPFFPEYIKSLSHFWQV